MTTRSLDFAPAHKCRYRAGDRAPQARHHALVGISGDEAIILQDSDRFTGVLEVSPTGRTVRRKKRDDDLCHGWAQVRKGVVTAVFAADGEIVLQHDDRRWALSRVRVEIADDAGSHRTATIWQGDHPLASLPYRISRGHHWQRRVDAAWDELNEESDDLFVLVRNLNTPEWRQEVHEQWATGFLLT